MTKTIFELTEGSAPLGTDYALTGEDPAGTHVLRRTTWTSIKNLFTSLQAAIGSDITTGTSTTLFATPKSLKDAGVVPVKLIGGVPHKQLWIAGWKPTLTSGCAQPAQLEMTTNKNVYDYLAFDASTIEYAYANVALPDDFSGSTIYAQFYWMHPATTTNFGVQWDLQAVTIGDGGNLDVAYGTAIAVADTGGTTSYLYISSVTPAITVTGTPAAGKLCQFRVFRYPPGEVDTLAVDAYLLGVMIWYPVV